MAQPIGSGGRSRARCPDVGVCAVSGCRGLCGSGVGRGCHGWP